MSNSVSPPGFPFNVDLTDRILMALPDFQSLLGLISCSKFVYSVFQCRQNSILGAIAHNQLGLALPQAMRLVGCLGDTHSSVLVRELPTETNLLHDFTVTPAQARLLRDNAATVCALEDIYSWREKDPRSKSSRLSVVESLRFQQSMYRLWFLAATYGPGALVDESFAHSDSGHQQLRDSIIKKQMAFLLSLREPELIGVDEVHRFLLDLAKWVLAKHTTRLSPSLLGLDDRDDIYLVWSGPAITLNAFKGMWSSPRPINSEWCGTWRAMTYAFFATEIASITGSSALSAIRPHFVLDDYFLKTVNCSRCRTLPSFSTRDSLWSFCNWEYMILAIAPLRLGNFLSFEGRRPLELFVAFTEAVESVPYPRLIEEIFDIRSERYKDWKKDDWLCTFCMTKLLSDSIQAWLDTRIMKADAPINGRRDPKLDSYRAYLSLAL